MFLNTLTSSMALSLCAASNSVFDGLKTLASELNQVQINPVSRPKVIQQMAGALITVDRLQLQGRLVPKITTASIRLLLVDPQQTDKAVEQFTRLIRSIQPTRPDIPKAKGPDEEASETPASEEDPE